MHPRGFVIIEMMNICISLEIKLNWMISAWTLACTEGTNLVDKHCWIRDWKGIDWIAWMERVGLFAPTCPSKAGLRKQIFHISDQFSMYYQFSSNITNTRSFHQFSVCFTYFLLNPIDKSFDNWFLTRSLQLQLTSTWTSTWCAR